MKILITSLAFIFLFAGYHTEAVAATAPERPVIAEPTGEITLRDALALTLVHNPELKAFSFETRAAQARELQAGLWPNPVLEVEFEEVGGTGERSGFDGAEATIVLSQLIELGEKSQKRKKVASIEKELAAIDLQDKKIEVFSEATKAFIAVLEAQEKLQLSEELLRLSEESFHAVQKRVDAGKDSPLEQTRALIALLNIRIQHGQAERSLDYTRRALAAFWGHPEPAFENVVGQLDDIDELLDQHELKNSLQNHPQYARWVSEVKKRQAVVELEKANGLGDITVGAGLQRFHETNENAIVFGVSIPIPLSDRNQGAQQEAVYNLSKPRHQQHAAWLKLQNELNRIYQEYANAYSQAVSIKNEILPGAGAVFEAANIAYQEGKVDYLNVLDAQRTLFEVKNRYIESLAAYQKARTDVERLVGQDIETIRMKNDE
jgi:cobalt-zinc-cadmium efflux system outer membrane protein